MRAFIFFCPVCCSQVDAQGEDGQRLDLECVSCGQVFNLTVDFDRVAEHSMH